MKIGLLLAGLTCALTTPLQAQLLKPVDVQKKTYAGGYVDSKSLGVTAGETKLGLYETKKGTTIYRRDAQQLSLGLPRTGSGGVFGLNVQQSIGVRAKNVPLFIGPSIEGTAVSQGGVTQRVTIAPGVEFGGIGYPEIKGINSEGLFAAAFYIQNNYGFVADSGDSVQPEYGIKIQYVGPKAVLNARVGNRLGSAAGRTHFNETRSIEYMHTVGKGQKIMLGGFATTGNNVVADANFTGGVRNDVDGYVGAKLVATLGK